MSTQSRSWPVLQRNSRPTHPHVEQGSQFWYQRPVLWKTIFPWTMVILKRSAKPRSLPHAVHSRFMLQWESNTTSDLTGGRSQAVIQDMGSGCKFKWDFAPLTCLPTAPAVLIEGDHYLSVVQGFGNPWHRGLHFLGFPKLSYLFSGYRHRLKVTYRRTVKRCL